MKQPLVWLWMSQKAELCFSFCGCHASCFDEGGACGQAGVMTFPITVTVWSDYVCPWCYVGSSELATLERDFEFKVDWRPFLLRPDAPEEGQALPEHIKQYLRNPQNPLFLRAQALGLTLVQRDIIPNTRRAHECTEYARASGKLEAFHHGLIERYWSHGQDLHDWAVLLEVAQAAGLDAQEMKSQVEEGRWKAEMEAGIAAGAQVGVDAVPTFIVGNVVVIRGAQEANVFRQAFERLRKDQE